MIGHINALARTSKDPESFIFMAGDSVHFCGEFRPSDALPLPATVDVPGLTPCPCPREVLVEMNPQKSSEQPYHLLSEAQDLDAANRTIAFLGRFDADRHVLLIFAHDLTLYPHLDYFPKLANDWRQKDWKQVGRWAFLADLQKLSREAGATQGGKG